MIARSITEERFQRFLVAEDLRSEFDQYRVTFADLLEGMNPVAVVSSWLLGSGRVIEFDQFAQKENPTQGGVSVAG